MGGSKKVDKSYDYTPADNKTKKEYDLILSSAATAAGNVSFRMPKIEGPLRKQHHNSTVRAKADSILSQRKQVITNQAKQLML